MKKRSVFLFGAGAALSWGGPSTWKLTSIIRNSGFVMKDNKTKITDSIYNELKAAGYEDGEANFETIINVVEEFIIYYSTFNKAGNTASIFKTFMELKNSDNILNFAVVGERKHGYRLQIPPGTPYEDSEPSLYNETPEERFFQELYKVLITAVNEAISEYAYHTESKSDIFVPKNEALNNAFVHFMKNCASEGPVRMYNLNYDRIFKVLLERNNIPVFDGFEYGEALSYDIEKLAPELNRILEDTSCHTHYNLHGSNDWLVEREDEAILPNPRIFITPYMNLAINESTAAMQIEKGRSIVISNIITGYQKAQKSFMAPFKQMQSAFDRDCMNADILYIIGYSFGDEHVNATIRTATLYNPALKVMIVDPAYSDMDNPKNNDKLVRVFENHFAAWLPYIHDRKRIGENHESYFGDRIHVYSIGFKEFLEK